MTTKDKAERLNVTELIARSNRLGADPRNTNYAGGNTSAKGTAIDPVTGEGVELLWVKGSGGDLGTLTPRAWRCCGWTGSARWPTSTRASTGRTRWWRCSTSACTAGARRAPSIDTAMHGLIDRPHVDHLHPDSGIALATAADGRS